MMHCPKRKCGEGTDRPQMNRISSSDNKTSSSTPTQIDADNSENMPRMQSIAIYDHTIRTRSLHKRKKTNINYNI